MKTHSAKQQLMQLINGNWVSQSLYGVAKLRVADHLASGPKTPEELAEVAHCDSGALKRVLRALASVGVFAELEEGRFSLTEVGDCLREGSPNSARATSLMMTEIFYPAWGKFLYSLQTGQSSFEHVSGQPLFEYLEKRPAEAALFDAAMVSYMKEESGAIASAYKWPDTGNIIDVGGGSGGLIRSVLASNPHLSGAIFDLPEVIHRNQEIYNGDEFLRNCQFHSGDFFASIPAGGDLYMFRNIIHDWDDDDCVKILSNCRQACESGSKILIMEYVIPEDDAPFAGKWLDLMMLVGPGGRERTEEEYRVLLAAADLQLTSVIPTATEMSILEAQPT